MACITTIDVVVEDLAAVLDLYDVIRIYRCTTGRAGEYTEITDANTRIPLLSSQLVYSFTDPAGDSTYFYQHDYYSTVSGNNSPKCSTHQGSSDPALSILSVEELKQHYLFGVDMSDDEGNEFPSTMFQHYIRSAVSFIEHQLDLPVRPVAFDATNPERHDFIRQDYYKYMWLQLKHYPVLSVDSIQLILPVGQKVIDVDPTWMHVDKDSGQIMIIPGQGAASQLVLGQGGAWLPLLYRNVDFIPDVFHVQYSAGFTAVPDDIKHMVGMMAAIGPLHVAGDLIIGAGIATESIGMDGLSQMISSTASATNSGFGARILHYLRALKREIPQMRRYYKGTRFVAG